VIAALIIVFREVFEAGLIVGIVLAVTRTVPHRNQWIAGGVLAGVLAACVVAAFAGALSNLFAGMGQEVFNAAILALAVVMLTWHNVWMARHGAELAGELREAGRAVVEGSKSLLALAIVVGVAVLREGSEVVLFLYGVLVGGNDSGLSVALGGLAGLVLGALVCMLTYFGLVKIPTRALFATTTVLIALLAAGMAATRLKIVSTCLK
jgi:high-affinity iron transporter